MSFEFLQSIEPTSMTKKSINSSGQHTGIYDAIVVGSGVSGLTAAKRVASNGNSCIVLEKQKSAGGLIKCTEVAENLYHLVGGHVFNTRIPAVSDWFWGSVCNQSTDFTLVKRNAKILIDDRLIGYPIENHLWELSRQKTKSIIKDLLLQAKNTSTKSFQTFGDFLLATFGETLCNTYFFPYNEKIWRLSPNGMALEWLDGKLPMPSLTEIIESNIFHEPESSMVHSSFFYPNNDGSQHIVNKLSESLDIKTNQPVETIQTLPDGELLVNSSYKTKAIIYTGDVRELVDILVDISMLPKLVSSLAKLPSHGTTNLLCSCHPNPISWTYIPEPEQAAHRIINTGSFSKNNTSKLLLSHGLSTCVVEFSGYIEQAEAEHYALKLPGIQQILSYNHNPLTYVIQQAGTRELINEVKALLGKYNIYLLGRFAEWEYYNMDTAMNSALNIADQLNKSLSMTL